MQDSQTIVLQLPETLEPEWITSALQLLDDDQSRRAVVIRGGSSVFCSGLPLERAAIGALNVPDALRALALLLDRLDTGSQPVVAVVDGDAKGGGVGLAAVADVVIARPESSFQLPEVLLGLIPADVFPFVARRIGQAAACRMALGEPALTAEQALRCGLVDIVSATPERELEIRLAWWTRSEPFALAAVRRLARRGWAIPEAIEVFADLWGGAAPQRIRRFVSGEAPWEPLA